MAANLKDALMGGPGLSGYAYQADVYCVECGRDLVRKAFDGRDEVSDLEFKDSDVVPQPIFFGESDVAQHCGECGEHLYGPEEKS